MTKQELELRNLEAEMADRKAQLTANYRKARTIFNNSRIISRRGIENIAVDLTPEFNITGKDGDYKVYTNRIN